VSAGIKDIACLRRTCTFCAPTVFLRSDAVATIFSAVRFSAATNRGRLLGWRFFRW